MKKNVVYLQPEYKTGDYIMFKMSEISDDFKDVIEAQDEGKLYQVLDVIKDAYFIDLGYMKHWFECEFFYTKLEIRSLKINKIINGIQRR